MVPTGLGFKNGTIILDEPNSVYYSGQLISGKVNFEISNPLTFSYINVTYIGDANVLWTEEEFETYNGIKRRKQVKHVGREVYFDFTQCLSGGDGINNGVAMLPAGFHTFPFCYQLPFTVPSSFKGEKGDVSYKIIASVLHQDGVTKEEMVQEFDVVAPLDLNTDEIKKPIRMEFEEVYSCNCSCAPKPLVISILIPHSGFCPGQIIPFVVDAKNDSNVEVDKIIFEVSKRMRYLSQQPMSAIIPPPEVIVSMEKGPILSKTNGEYIFELKLPDFIALNLDNCAIIDVGYFLKVTMKVSGCNDDLTDEAEICMGLEPIGSNVDVNDSHPMADHLPISQIPKQPQADTQPPPYDDSLIPSFQNNLQICPPAPMSYPNVGYTNMFGSKNNIASPFEYHSSQNPSPYSPYPQNANTYPNMTQSQISYVRSPQNGLQMPTLPPGQSYSPQVSAYPSAPPQ